MSAHVCPCGEPEDGPLGWHNDAEHHLVCNACGLDPHRRRVYTRAERLAARTDTTPATGENR